MVEIYQAAAEQYGYIVAGSNNSRNGPWPVSSAAAQAIGADLGQRFSIDPQRMYATGMSGGARVAMMVALSNTRIAGVIASSAGYPDSQPRSNVPFAVFGTTGTEDFNYLEMRQLDRALKTPHHLAVFNGGHTLPPDNVAFEAIDWMELQAMKSGRRARDEALIDRLLQKRRAAVDASTSPTETVHLLDALVADFSGLRDVSSEAARAKDLAKQPDVKKALARERASDDAEARMLGDVFELEAALAGADARVGADEPARPSRVARAEGAGRARLPGAQPGTAGASLDDVRRGHPDARSRVPRPPRRIRHTRTLISGALPNSLPAAAVQCISPEGGVHAMARTSDPGSRLRDSILPA